MIIDQLPEISTVQETDEIPVERGTTTYKSTLQKLKDLVASLLTKSDVGLGNVDNVRQYSVENPPPERSWSIIGTATGNTPVSITGNVSEISIDVQYGTNNLYFPFHFVREQLSDSARVYTIGYYINATTSGFCQISAAYSSVNVLSLYISGTDYTSTARMRVFAK